jgi:hypothetical protein
MRDPSRACTAGRDPISDQSGEEVATPTPAVPAVSGVSEGFFFTFSFCFAETRPACAAGLECAAKRGMRMAGDGYRN